MAAGDGRRWREIDGADRVTEITQLRTHGGANGPSPTCDDYDARRLGHELDGHSLIVPRELVEAASIDGVSRLGTLFRIGLPLVRSGVVAIGIFSFLLSWDEYLVASTLLQRDEYRTMPTQLILSFIGQFAYQWGPMMAAAVMLSIPIFVLFLTFQRQIVAGLTAGAVKG